MEPQIYTSLWKKYRPVILKLMSDSVEGPQHYKLFPHEFKAAGEKRRTDYTFLLEAANGKALNNIKTSIVAQDLLLVLQQSQRASQLMTEATFELRMDKQFIFHVNRKEEIKVEEPSPAEV